jgi:hypothetical protein
VLGFSESKQAFLATRPEWTCRGALLKTADGLAARVEQTPFMWVDGAWEAEVTIMPVEAGPGMQTITLKARITPDTLRRWADMAINPFIEACAQLQDHWRRAKRESQDTVTWL